MHAHALIFLGVNLSIMGHVGQLFGRRVNLVHLHDPVLSVLKLIVSVHAGDSANAQGQKANAASNNTCNSSTGQFTGFVHLILLLEVQSSIRWVSCVSGVICVTRSNVSGSVYASVSGSVYTSVSGCNNRWITGWIIYVLAWLLCISSRSKAYRRSL